MADLDIFRDEFLPNIQAHARLSFATWQKSSPADAARWIAYRDALLAGGTPTPPAMTTKYGKALVAAGRLVAAGGMPPPPPPPPTGYPASFYTGPAGAQNILPPKRGAFLGVAQADGAGEPPVAQQIAELETYLGRALDIEHRFLQGTNNLDSALVAAIHGRNHWPMISWIPFPTNGQRILNGEADAGIVSFGQQIAAQPHRLFLRPCWEFNGQPPWYDHARKIDGSAMSATEHRAMFRRIVDKLRQGGAFPKATIVWCPDEGYYGNGDFFDETIAYPGDDYVDWVGSDGYNGGGYCGNHAGWCTFPEIYTHGRCLGGPNFGVQCAVANTPVGTEVDFRGRKPFMAAETGTVEGPQKGDWHRQVRDYIKNHMSGCLAFVYFDIDVRLYGEGNNWRIGTSDASKQGFRDLAADPYFNTRA